MSLTKNMGIVVGIFLVFFIFVAGNVVLFGLFGEILNISSLTVFKTVYFVFIFLLLGLIYWNNAASINTVLAHILIIFSLIIVSAGLATLAGQIKIVHDVTQGSLTQDIIQLQSQNANYAQYAQNLKTNIDSVRADNAILSEMLINISQKLNNRTPQVVETVITIPPEIIYVNEQVPVSDIVAPANVNERREVENDD